MSAQEKLMKLPGAEFFATIAGEKIERLMIPHIEEAIKEAMIAGKSSHGIVSSVIIAIGKSPVLTALGKIPGVNASDLFLVLASALKHTKILDKAIPDSTDPRLHKVKMMLQHVAPHVIIALGNGITDAVKVEAEMSKHVSDEIVPPDKRDAPWDYGIWIDDPTWIDGMQFYIPIRVNGDLVMHADGKTPYGDKVFERAYKQWCQDHGFITTRTQVNDGQPDRNGRQKKKIVETKVPKTLATTKLPLETILEMSGVGIDLDQVEVLKKLIADSNSKKEDKPKKWSEEVSDEVHEFMFAVSATLEDLPPLDRVIDIDHFEDLVGKADVIQMNKLAAKFIPKIQANGKFTLTDLRTIVRHVDTWMGTELKQVNKLRFHLANMRKAIMGGVSISKAFLIFMAVTSPFWIAGMLTILGLIYGVSAFISGAYAHLTPLTQGSAVASALIGLVLVVSILQLSRIAMIPLQWIPFFRENGYKNFVSKITAALVPFGALMILFLVLEVPLFYRLVLTIAGIAPLGLAAILDLMEPIDTDKNGFRYNETKQAYVWLKRLTVVVPYTVAIGGAILHTLKLSPMGWIAKAETFMDKYPYALHFSILAAGMILILLVAAWVTKKIEVTTIVKDGKAYTGHRRNWVARIGFGALILLIAAWSGMEMWNLWKERFFPTTASTQIIAQPVSPTTPASPSQPKVKEVVDVEPPPQKVTGRGAPKSNSVPRSQAVKPAFPRLDCAKLNPLARRQYGCE